MNRRRMMMQLKRVRNEIEISEANTLILDISYRRYKKVNEGSAVCAINKVGKYWVPILVSEDPDAVVYLVNDFTYSAVTTVEYGGKLYYVSNYGHAQEQSAPIRSNPYNLPVLNDVVGTEPYPVSAAGQQQAAKDLLDYYFGKV